MVLFLLSWNVAGWASTVERIRAVFPTLHDYFERIGADIIALQEVKSSWDTLKKKPFQAGACDQRQNDLAGWESFWACSQGLRGFNGVATFAKKGLVHRADAAPFKSEKLNNEGRCIVTYHSRFVLFNVYVVNGRHGERQEFKSEFLAALRDAMCRVRSESGLPIALCGDLNLCYRVQDAHWTHRRLMFQQLSWLSGHQLYAPPPLPVAAAPSSVEAPPQLRVASLTNGEKRPHSDSRTKKKAEDSQGEGSDDEADLREEGLENEQRTGEGIEHSGRERWISYLQELGATATPEERAAARRVLVAVARHLKSSDEHRELLQSTPELPAVAAGCLTADVDDDIVALAAKVVKTVLHEHRRTHVWVQQFLTHNLADPKNADLFTVSRRACEAPHPVCDRVWVTKHLLGADGMVDTFAALYPQAEACATCWDQSRNKRYENCGNRIDYIIVDVPLADAVSRAPQHLQPQLEADALADRNDISGRCGVRRATEHGRYRPAPTLGPTGLEPLSAEDASLQFAGLPSSGLFLSPPQFSDHVGVTLVLDMDLAPRSATLEAATLKCMYRAEYKHSVLDLFAKRTASLQEARNAAATTAAPQQAASSGDALDLKRSRSEAEPGKVHIIISDDDAD